MFEKMEASAQRKRQQLMSEGDSDTLSSPSTLHPSPLLSHKQLKERRSSTSSKKFQMMPGGKMCVCVGVGVGVGVSVGGGGCVGGGVV